MTTVTRSTTDVAADPTIDRTTGAGFVTAALQSAKRTVLQFFRTPQLLMLGTVQGALFLFMFRYIFGGAINPGGGIDYVDFLVPGFLATGILWLGMPAATGVAEDAATGVHDRLRSLPIPRASVMFGRSIADTALTGWGLLVTTVLAFIVGFRLNADVAEVALAVVVLVAAAYSFMWVFITIGLTSKSAQAATGTCTLLIVPLAFISAAYVPAETLPGWMQPIAEQPAVHDLQQRPSLPDPGRRRRGRPRAQHRLLGGAELRVVRRDLPGVQHDRRVAVRQAALTGGARRSGNARNGSALVVEEREIELLESLGVGECVDCDDLPVHDREPHDRERLSVARDDGPGRPVHEGWPFDQRRSRECHRPTGELGCAPNHDRQARTGRAAVRTRDHVGVQDFEERVEVAATRGGEERVDHLSLTAQIGVRDRGAILHTPAGSARELTRRLR